MPFLTGCKQLCSAISVSFSTVYVIERETFLKILSERQPDFVFLKKVEILLLIILGKILRNQRQNRNLLELRGSEEEM